jgi:hypothetical protein
VEIKSSQIRPESLFKAHHFRHLVTGTVVFVMGILAEEGLVLYKQHLPKRVQWQTGELQTNYFVFPRRNPSNNPVEVGWSEDGVLVWRPKR